MVFGAAAYVTWVEPIATKDIDILLYPFPSDKMQDEITDNLCNELNCIQKTKSIDAWEGNRLIIKFSLEESVVSIEFWEKILRRDPINIFNRRVLRSINSLKAYFISLEDFIASKLCELTPEPLDKYKIEKIFAKWGDKINLNKVITAIIELNHETTAVFNILNWYPSKLPRHLKKIIVGLLGSLSTPIRNDVVKLLEERGDPIGIF